MGTVLDSLNSALLQAFLSDEKLVLLGEDILDPYGGAFIVTRGLSTRFPERVFTTPVSEAGIVGLAAGMALRSLHPVVEIMFGDFPGREGDAPVSRTALGHGTLVPLPDRASAHRLRQALRVVDQGPAQLRRPGGDRPGVRGAEDFASYAEARSAVGERETRVKIERVEVAEAGELILIRVLGSHFLWKMVRRMVGVVAEVGRGSLAPKDAERFLRERSDVPATLTAPPSGLFLERVLYEGDAPPGPLRPVLNL